MEGAGDGGPVDRLRCGLGVDGVGGGEVRGGEVGGGEVDAREDGCGGEEPEAVVEKLAAEGGVIGVAAEGAGGADAAFWRWP